MNDRRRRRSRRPRPRARAAGAARCSVADERVERERDHRGGQEEEEDVTERAREQEREQEQHRQPDELDPARDPDRRAQSAIGSIVALVPGSGSRLRRNEVGVRRALPWARWPRRAPGRRPACVRADGAPSTARASRPPLRSSGCSGSSRCSLTAFGSSGTPTVAAPICHRLARGRRGRPTAAARARHGRQPPGAASGRGGLAHGDRLPRHERRRAHAPAGRTPGEQGLLARLWHGSPAAATTRPGWYQLEGGDGGHEGARRRRARRAPTSTRRCDGHGRRDQRLRRRRAGRRQPDRHPARRVAVGDRLADPRRARPVARGRVAGARGDVEARHRRSTSPRSSGRRSRRTPRRREQRRDRRASRGGSLP